MPRAPSAGLPVLGDAVRAALGRAFGPPRVDFAAGEGDPGLFGPSSASWRVLGEPAAIVGGVRSLLVQVLHPLAVAGVADHSSYRGDPLGRLRRTSSYVTVTAFARTEDALGAARGIRRGHRRVRGTAPDGRPYDAGDPHLLAWVSMALTSSMLASHRAYAPDALTPAQVDAFVDEQSRAAALLDPRVDLEALATDEAALAALREGTLELPLTRDGSLPSTGHGLEARMRDYDDELRVGAQGREVLSFLRWPAIGALRAGYLPLLAAAVACLEPEQRRLIGLPSSALAFAPVRLQSRVMLAGFRASTGVSPAVRAAMARCGITDDRPSRDALPSRARARRRAA